MEHSNNLLSLHVNKQERLERRGTKIMDIASLWSDINAYVSTISRQVIQQCRLLYGTSQTTSSSSFTFFFVSQSDYKQSRAHPSTVCLSCPPSRTLASTLTLTLTFPLPLPLIQPSHIIMPSHPEANPTRQSYTSPRQSNQVRCP